eukprot:gene1322-11405_t
MNKRTRSQRIEDEIESEGRKKRHGLRSLNGKTLLSKNIDISEDELSEFSDTDSDDFNFHKKRKYDYTEVPVPLNVSLSDENEQKAATAMMIMGLQSPETSEKMEQKRKEIKKKLKSKMDIYEEPINAKLLSNLIDLDSSLDENLLQFGVLKTPPIKLELLDQLFMKSLKKRDVTKIPPPLSVLESPLISNFNKTVSNAVPTLSNGNPTQKKVPNQKPIYKNQVVPQNISNVQNEFRKPSPTQSGQKMKISSIQKLPIPQQQPQQQPQKPQKKERRSCIHSKIAHFISRATTKDSKESKFHHITKPTNELVVPQHSQNIKRFTPKPQPPTSSNYSYPYSNLMYKPQPPPPPPVNYQPRVQSYPPHMYSNRPVYSNQPPPQRSYVHPNHNPYGTMYSYRGGYDNQMQQPYRPQNYYDGPPMHHSPHYLYPQQQSPQTHPQSLSSMKFQAVKKK